MLSTRFFAAHRTKLVNCKRYSLFATARFYNTGLLRKTTSLPDRVGLELSKDRKGKMKANVRS